MDIRKITKGYLEAKGYDGLYSDYLGCGCENSNLMPCSEPREDCEAGFKQKCNLETCEADGDCPFHIGEKKEQSP